MGLRPTLSIVPPGLETQFTVCIFPAMNCRVYYRISLGQDSRPCGRSNRLKNSSQTTCTSSLLSLLAECSFFAAHAERRPRIETGAG